jgi:transketolase
MRTAFINELIIQARIHPEIFLVVGDLGFSVIEPFAAEFPDRFLNAGVAEQNMTGVAAGLASEGYHVFTYSIANFPTLRCLEQIRNDVCYHDLPVTVVAVGAGTAYGNLGYSHHCVQDVACLRGLPGITILSPGDPGETRACVRQLAANPCPSYLRLGKAGEACLHEENTDFSRPISVRSSGSKIAMLATGSVLKEAVDASILLQKEGISCDVLSFVCLTADPSVWSGALRAYDIVLTVEEHLEAGGIGEMIAATVGSKMRIERAFLTMSALGKVGSQAHLRFAAGLDAASLAARVRTLME